MSHRRNSGRLLGLLPRGGKFGYCRVILAAWRLLMMQSLVSGPFEVMLVPNKAGAFPLSESLNRSWLPDREVLCRTLSLL
jgi:hypothetical protein